MKVKFILPKEGRKSLVAAIGEIIGWAPVYKGAPSFAFVVNNYKIERDSTLVCDERVGPEDLRNLLADLTERGFVFEGDIDGITPVATEQSSTASNGLRKIEASSVENGECRLSINVPLIGFSASSLDNLAKLITAKAWILRKMTGTEELSIERDEKYLRFPWFRQDASAAEIDAYLRLIAGLCETAKSRKRVTATERRLEDGDHEKFIARCFLLSLGFIGKDSAPARKILLAPMSGSGSHKSGDHKKSYAPNGVTTAASGEETPEATDAPIDGFGADNAPTVANNNSYDVCRGYATELHYMNVD